MNACCSEACFWITPCYLDRMFGLREVRPSDDELFAPYPLSTLNRRIKVRRMMISVMVIALILIVGEIDADLGNLSALELPLDHNPLTSMNRSRGCIIILGWGNDRRIDREHKNNDHGVGL